jgi:class 3 adenylate cyclase
MAWLIVHVVTFAAVNAFLVFVWLVTGGDRELLTLARSEPVDAVRDGFWPGWVMASWAPLLVIHAGAWLATFLSGGWGRRRRLARKQERRDRRHQIAAAVREAAVTHKRQREEWVGSLARQWSHPNHHKPWSIFGCDGEDATASEDRHPEVAGVPARTGRHWVAVMFTDICHSTELAEELGDDAWIELLAGHRRLVRECLTANGGSEVGTQGDGFLVRFETPEEAVACAADIQRRVAAQRDSRANGPTAGAATPEVRIGIHAGEAIAEEGDLVGRVINLAYRVAAVAEAGEVLVTEPVADRTPPGTTMADRGLQSLKGIAQPRHLLSVEWRFSPATPSGDGAHGDAVDVAVPVTTVLPDQN